MRLEKIPLKDTGKFSTFFLDYVNRKEPLNPLYNLAPTAENFIKQISEKEFTIEKRKLLADVLKEQYTNLEIHEKVKLNLQKLEDSHTYTVTTGHQLNIFTGPLYFIYKIISTINCCKHLNENNPEYHFVPVYWMASEDHDYEEIKDILIKGKKYTWKSDQQGAVGRFNPQSLAELADQIPGGKLFKEHYANSENLATAVRKYVNDLFGKYGLITIDPDHPKLKSSLIDVIKDDLENHTSNDLVNKTSEKIEGLGYKSLVFPRKINFFYLENDLRCRIVSEDSEFKGVDSDWKMGKKETLDLAQNSPEKFSPNVILRPLYQELILPNLGYIGGPAEIVYWLQLKEVFNYFQVPFPILVPRNFAMIVPGYIQKKINKIGLNLQALFQDTESLKKDFTQDLSENDLTLLNEKKEFEELYAEIKNKAIKIDSTLEKHIIGETKRAQNNLERIEKKFLRAEKRKHRDILNQIDSVQGILSPGGKLQERTENLLAFYYDIPDFIDHLMENLDPFDPRFHILFEND